MPEAKACESCEEPFTPKTPIQRFCGATCRQRAHRAPKASANGFEKATRKELERLGKLDTMLGQQALVIAARMGSKGETGSAIATLSREHSRLMAAVKAGATPADPVAEAQRKRQEALDAAQAQADE